MFALVVLLGTLAAPPASAQWFGRNKVQYDVFHFRVLETEHFNIHFYPETELGVRDAARMAERWYARLSPLMGHTFERRMPIILYADDTDFRQTNVIPGLIGEGVQGFFEGMRQRIVMPLTGSYAATDHVLGHEIVHQLQFDIAARKGQASQFMRLPLWIVEGMAEYLALGRFDPHTAMWMRDAVIRDAFPTLEALTRDPRYFPYRYGQAFFAWIGGTYGDEAVTQLFRAALVMPLDSAIVSVTGLQPDSLQSAWRQGLEEAYLPRIRGMQAPPYLGPGVAGARPERLEELGLVPLPGRRVLARDIDAGNLNISPAVSPDGRYVAFLSERDLFGIDLFLADAQTGAVLRRLQSVGTDPHLDAIRWIDSAGTWSPDGRQFAFVIFREGGNEIAILDVATRVIQRRIRVTGVGAITNPSWSPDGQRLAFTGISGGIANLYVVDIQGGRAQQLTQDRHADLQAAWSPDGRTIAFATDRGPQTSFERLTFSPLKLALYDVEAHEVRIIDVFDNAKHINPQFSPDGESLFFVSDRGGISNVYRLHLPSGDVFQVTNVATGISGITAISPTLSVAAQTGLMMYSVFEAQHYNVYALEPEQAVGVLIRSGIAAATAPAAPGAAVPAVPADAIQIEDAEDILPAQPEKPPAAPPPPVDTAEVAVEEPPAAPPQPLLAEDDPGRALLAILPPAQAARVSRVERFLADPQMGLPPTGDFPDRPYRPRLGLDFITQPVAGVGYDAFTGFGVGGGIAMRFSDMLGDHVLGAVVQAQGTLRDIGGQVIYFNQRRRLNWGGGAAHIPILQMFITPPIRVADGWILRMLQRTYLTQVGGVANFPLSQSLRFEGNLGLRRIGYGFEVDIYDGMRLMRRSLATAEAEHLFGFEPGTLDALFLAEGGIAYVGDYSFFGFTSPVRGGRFRFGLDGTAGSLNFATAVADWRRYLFFRPFFTLAFRGLHFGRHGPDAGSDRLFPLFLGHGTLVRGYANFDHARIDDPRAALDRMYGTALGVGNFEIRIPLTGTRDFGMLEVPFLPMELSLFADAGMVWGEVEGFLGPGVRLGRPFGDQQPIFSSGVSLRVNLLGAMIAEIYYAAAFNRPDGRVGVFGFNFTPGW